MIVCMCWWSPGLTKNRKKKKKKVQSWNVEVVAVQMEGGTAGLWTEERLGPSVRFCGWRYRFSEKSIHLLLSQPGRP